MLVETEHKTTFESYIPERYSKTKRYAENGKFSNILSKSTINKLKRICKNCHCPYGSHHAGLICPPTYILK